jgi:protein-S-isoprenylcysteine O-methyltransferase Ste14
MVSVGLVVLQLIALAAVVWPWQASHWNAWAWLPICAAFAVKGWTIAHNRPGNFSILPEPRARTRLITTGPYAHTRHPLYFGLILFGLGCAIGWNTPVHWLAAAALAVVLDLKSRREERFLIERFPEYRDYVARTTRLLPRLLPHRPR